jgi:hypothetical protein
MTRMSCRIFYIRSQAPLYNLTWVGGRHLRTQRTAQSVLQRPGERWYFKLWKKSCSHLAIP